MSAYARIAGWGYYVPTRVITNAELERIVQTSDAWIVARTGIRERRAAADDETTSTLATIAARRALAQADRSAGDVDLVIVATFSPDNHLPACASLVQHAIGAGRAAAFDLNAACSGFVYALATATQFIRGGLYRTVLVVGAEVLTRAVDWTDRSTCVLFGDGAGAVLLEASDEPTGPLGFVLGSDGAGGDLLWMPTVCHTPARYPVSGRPAIKMVGSEVFKFAVNIIPAATRQVVAEAGLALEDVDLFIFHQANERIIRAAAKALGVPAERVFVNVDRYGNTSAASIPIALCEAIEQGLVREGDRLVFVGFGGGLAWGACLVQWGVRPHVAAARLAGAATGARRNGR